jgi:hypothetical protein
MFRFSAGARDFLFPKASGPAVEFTQPPVPKSLEAVSSGIKQPKREVKH